MIFYFYIFFRKAIKMSLNSKISIKKPTMPKNRELNTFDDILMNKSTPKCAQMQRNANKQIKKNS